MYHDIQRNTRPCIDIMNVFVSVTIKQSKLQTYHNALRLMFFSAFLFIITVYILNTLI